MKKEYIIGGLALVGGVALVAYLLKPKAPRRNSEGFFGMDGRRMGKVVANCGRRNADGSYSYYYDGDGQCNQGWKNVKFFGDRNF